MEMQNRDLDELYSETITELEEGTILKGRIISIKSDSVVVDIGYKSEGFVPIEELSENEREKIREGGELEVYLSRVDSDNLIVLSIERARLIRTYQLLQEALKKGNSVESTILEKIKGGYRMDINGVKAFMPTSQTDLKPLKYSDSLLGQKVNVKVLKLNNNRLTNIIVSRRAFLEEERESLKEKTLLKLKIGAIVQGVVKNIADYGVFVGIGGIDGLLHISDISWGKIRHPSDVFKVGQEIEVMVINFERETEKVTLGFKQKKPDPWVNISKKYIEGEAVRGKVVSLTDYGAFVELEEDVEGLIHISEFDWSIRHRHPSHYVEIGDYVNVKVLKVDTVERRISLGIKQLKPKPWELVAQRYKVGQCITGRVRSFAAFGAFIGLPEGVDALLHISDMSWTKHIRHPSEILRKGQKIEALVLKLEPEQERMAIGLKQLIPNPWEKGIPGKYHLGDNVICKVLRQTDFGIFVDIEGEIEGLVYAPEINKDGNNFKDTYKIGDEVVAKIIKIDLYSRKIGLSLKNLKREDETNSGSGRH